MAETPENGRLRAVLRDEIFALAAPNIMAVLLVLFAPTMVASMRSGLIALFVLWVFGVALSFAVKPNWRILGVYRFAFAVSSAVVYVLLGWYYAANFESPITKADLAAATFQSPSVVISDLIAIPPTNTDIFNLNFVNQGQSGVTNPIPHFGIGYSNGPVKPICEDEMFFGFDRFPQPPAGGTDVLDRNESRTATLPPNLDDKQGITLKTLKDLQQKKMSLILDIDIRFRDVRTNDLWQAERCEYWDFNVPAEYLSRILPHMCKGHNGTFLVTPMRHSRKATCTINPLP